jgi:hypothetical protein
MRERLDGHPWSGYSALIRIGERRVHLRIVLTTHTYEGGIEPTRTENKGFMTTESSNSSGRDKLPSPCLSRANIMVLQG